MMLKLKNIAFNYLQSLDKSMKLAIKDQYMCLFDFGYKRLVYEAYEGLEETSEDEVDKVVNFERVCALVSLVLPKPSDPILYEDDGPFGIDDLLYTSHYLTDLNFLEDEIIKNTVCNRFPYDIYYYVFASGINENILNSNIFDLTLIQLLQCHIDCDFDKILLVIQALISSENELLILRGLKLLTLALRFQKHRLEKLFEMIARIFDMSEYLWIFNLRNMQPDIHPIKHRIMAWVSKQSSVVYEHFKLKCFRITFESQPIPYDPEVLQEDRIEAFIRQLAKDMKPCALVDETFCVVLKIYLMSSVDEDKKLNFLDHIFENFHKNFKDKWPAPLICIANVVRDCFSCLCKGYCTPTSSDRVREIDECYGSKSFSAKDIKKLMDEILKGKQTIEEQRLLIRILGYNKFMNILNTITILYESFKNCIKYVDSERFLPEAEIFRAAHRLKRILIKQVESPDDRDRLRNKEWILENIIIKCPFTIFAKHQEYLIDDLIDVLNGKEKDEEVMEEIHFALNSITSKEKFKQRY